MFVPHAQLLRGALNTLWRQSQKGLKDLQDVVNTQGLSKEVCTGHNPQYVAIQSKMSIDVYSMHLCSCFRFYVHV